MVTPTTTTQNAQLVRTSLRDLCSANNEGAEAMLGGGYLQAFRVIHDATRSIAGSLGTTMKDMERTFRESMSIGASSATTAAAVQQRNIHVQPMPTLGMYAVGDELPGCIFAQPFILSYALQNEGREEKEAEPNFLDVRICVAVSIFNMALACHLESIIADECLKAEALSLRARVLYLQAHKLLQIDHSHEESPPRHQDQQQYRHHQYHEWVHLAIHANLIQNSLSRGDLEQARSWKTALEQVLTEDSDNDPVNHGDNDRSEYSMARQSFREIQIFYVGSFVAARSA